MSRGALALALVSATAVHAIGLGGIVEQSSLGEPVRFVVEVLVNTDDLAGDELAAECFKLVPGPSPTSGDLPQLAFGRAALERSTAGLRVVVTSPAVANDPALSFTVQAGCRLKIRHEYTALLDPPIIREPLAVEPLAVESSATTAKTAPPRRTEATTTAAKSSSGAAKHPAARAKAHPRTQARGDGAGPAASVGAAVKRGASPSSAAAAARDRAGPRLSISHSAQAHPPGASMSDIAQGRSDEEIARDVEAETVVLQRRIAELSATLERMEAKLREATAEREAAERAAKPTPPAPSWPGPWLVSIALALIAITLAAMLARSRGDARLEVPAFAHADAMASDDEPTALGSAASLGEVPRGAAAVREPPRGAASALAPARNDERPLLDHSDTFEEDLLRYAEQTSGHSVLEREQPKVVASVIRDWGNPRVIAYLRELLVAPRNGSRPFSPGAVSDLILLQSLAMERAGHGPEESPWNVDVEVRRQRTA